MTPGKPDIHQRVAKRIDAESYSLEHSEVGLVADILEEEYGPIIKAAIEVENVSSSSIPKHHIDAQQQLRAALSKKGLL